jgi:ribonuclease BN (tRNA processing enzyme)
MRLHCLGTAGFHPNSNRHTSCYFLPESGVLLDAGTGVFRLAPLIQTETIDLLLSHAHLDHICGLTFLLDVFYQRPVKKLRIWGEAAKLDAVRTHLFSELIFPVDLDAEWLPIDDLTQFNAGGAQVSWRPQQHPGGSVGYRLDWNAADQVEKSLVYLTDTTGDVSEEGIKWCGTPDLLMHECYFDDSMIEWAKKTGHSWTSRVTEVVAAVKPRKLLVTHVNPLIGAPPVAGSKSNPASPLPGDFQPQCDLIAANVDACVLLADDEMVVDF